MDVTQKTALMEYLETFVTPERRAKIDAVLAQRTRHITVVAEDFHNAHNASAILRTCEGFGIQDIHVVENFNTFKARRGAASGSEKWVAISRYGSDQEDNTRQCLSKLRSLGYLIAATSPHEGAVAPAAIPLDQKLAVWFGSERYGVSQTALQAADFKLKIPMVGFIESLNVSVSVALCLYVLTQRLYQMEIDWHLSDREQRDLRLEWLRQSARHGDRLEQHFLAQQGW
ncbi:RNA methyltransferase [Oscillatoria sp. CS-180]|uniref:TrmH family RNA methyltransferase n=1 Tax=Oscillatoria sp. CS-180 TaxID=3021720 RepID=UPI00232B4251|nr:RNA methyltransferase [Oscillatoria sp. CS-180]MDB9524505.1 RNA methyltransferase [Oscillatoria sp. CS-180]